MAKSLREVMNGKSDEGLMDYLDNFQKYTPEAIRTVVDELKSRGRNFNDEELKEINIKIEKRTKAESEEDTLFAPNNAWKQSVVTDPNAPLFYSKGAITAFSLFFSTIFGAVLLSSNINDTKRKWIVIGFGIIYTTVSIIILNLIPPNTFYVLLLNTAGGLGLTSTFWDKYVGKETKYRAKPIWKPLIISIIITIPFLLAIIYG
ncbi:MAG: hypothetical protein KF845_16385 [Cyclobacteriaceae bacterium]|nr:hypothetical protein [Cyclobacteriaceae bacterium]